MAQIKNTQLTGIMETRCYQCNSRFRITEYELNAAQGKVRCGECGIAFNAVHALTRYPVQPGDKPESENESIQEDLAKPELSLHEAMYGQDKRRFPNFAPLTWLIGILLLLVLSIVQGIYYQRYQLIGTPRLQQQVLSLCRLLPCNESQFSNSGQIKLLERHIFTHPLKADALMITGSFVNQAPFVQKTPRLLVSLFDLQGNLIANRIFSPSEYLPADTLQATITTAKPMHFRLEIIDPGTDAFAYEFEFI